MTALMWAAACGHLSLAQFLVKEKADVNAKDIDGRGLGCEEVWGWGQCSGCTRKFFGNKLCFKQSGVLNIHVIPCFLKCWKC